MLRKPNKFLISKKFSKNTDGVAAIEFALLAPLFFALTFAILELLLYMISSMWLENGTQYIQTRVQEIKNEGNFDSVNPVGQPPATDDAAVVALLRQELCSKFGGISILTSGCKDERLKLALWASGSNRSNFPSDDTPSFPLTETSSISPNGDLTREDIWIIGLQIDWPFILPTTRLLHTMPTLKKGEVPPPPTMATVRTAVVPTELVARPN